MRGSRAYKIQEFVAHSDRTNCLQVGRKSSGVLVTGGDDGVVNVWAIGKPAAILSLTGHVTAVTSVCFDDAEECVLAGSYSATLKLYDLEQSKVVCTATGHRSSVECVAFHPSGPFFGSGSLDTNFKLWDKRQKGCVATFKGHTKGITQLSFSPDGRWVVTGSEDSTVKLWDLTAGKLLHDFTSHSHPVTAVQFNPCEFVLATAAADRTTSFFDLDTFERIDTCGPETSIPRSLCFSPDGAALFSAFQDGLRVYGYEPARTLDYVDVPWGKVQDVTICDRRVLGCALNGAAVSVWVAKLSSIAPFHGAAPADNAAAGAHSVDQGRQPAGGPDLGRMPSARDASSAGAENGMGKGPQQPNAVAAVSAEVQTMTIKPKPGMANASTEVGDSLVRGALQPGALQPGAALAASPAAAPQAPQRTPQRVPSQRHHEPSIEIYEGRPRPTPPSASGAAPSSRDGHASGTPGPSAGQPGTQHRDSSAGGDLPAPRGFEASGPDDVLRFLDSTHARFCDQIEARQSNMSLIKVFWRQGDVKALMGALRRCNDAGLAADVLKMIKSDSSAFKLDVCADAAQVVGMCLASRVEGYVVTAVEFCTRLLRGFSQVIRDTTRAGRSAGGVDLSYEDRMRKCFAAKDAFQGLVPQLERVLASSKVSDVRRQSSELIELVRSL